MKKQLCMIGTALAACGAIANPVGNPGFEEGTAGWNIEVTDAVPSSVELFDGDAHSGSNSLKLSFEAPYTPNVYSAVWQNVPVRPSSKYRISFWAKAPEGNVPLYFGGGEGWAFRDQTAAGPFDWTEFSTVYETGPEEREFHFRFFVDNTLKDFLIDDVNFERLVDPDDPGASLVTSYGAVADGVTDSTGAFNRAFAAGNTVVTIPAGNFLVSGLEVPAGCTLTGMGAESKLSLLPGSESPWVVRLADGSSVSNFAIEAPETVNGVFMSWTKRNRISNMTMRNLKYAVMTDHAADVVIDGCFMENVGKAVEIVFSDNLRISNNDVRQCREHGIQFWGNYDWNPDSRNRDLIITGNVVKDGGAGAIWGTGYDNITISNNLVDGAEDVGIDLEWCFDAVITSNVVRNTENGGISLFFTCKRISIVGNTILNDRKFTTGLHDQFAIRAGIWLTYLNNESFKEDSGHEDITIVGNTIWNPDTNRRAMFIGSGSKRVQIESNTVNQGEIWLGGEHNKPLVLDHVPNGSIWLDENGKATQNR